LHKHPALVPIASSEKLSSFADSETVSQLAAPTTTLESSADPERVVRQGYLQILKSYKTGVKGWKSLWVVLRARNFCFYKDDQEYSAVKLFPMDSIINAAEIDPISKSKKYCFQVITDDKSYRFCALSEDDLLKWLGAFQSVLSRRHAGRNVTKGKSRAPGVIEGAAALSLQ
jgi:hypothetical protein